MNTGRLRKVKGEKGLGGQKGIKGGRKNSPKFRVCGEERIRICNETLLQILPL